jgi:hypothetical protein
VHMISSPFDISSERLLIWYLWSLRYVYINNAYYHPKINQATPVKSVVMMMYLIRIQILNNEKYAERQITFRESYIDITSNSDVQLTSYKSIKSLLSSPAYHVSYST